MHWNSDWHMGSMGWMGLWWILIVPVLIAAVWFALRRGDSVQESPKQVLKRRYANGEMNRETYQRTLEDLRKRNC